jgi:tetratricopeptide (TPR) repeat protein
MRKEFVVVLLAFAAATVPASAQQMGVRGGAIYHDMGTMDYGMAPQENDYATARRLIHFGKYAEAIPYLNNAHMEQPHKTDIIVYLGYAHHMTGDNDLALDYYRVALQEDPDHLLAREYLGELYLSLNYLPSAQEQLARLNQLCPSGCDERDALTKAIATYQASASAAPATPPKSSN